MADMTTALTRKKKVLVILGVIALIVVAGGAGVWLRSWQAAKNDDTTSTGRKQTVSGLPKSVDDVQQLRAQGNTAEAQEKIEQALSNPSATDTEKYQLYIQQGNLLTDKNDYAGAAAIYAKAEALDKTYEIMVLSGDTWLQAGDKAKAKDYYQKAIPLIPQSSPIREDEKAALEQKIKALDG